MKVVPYTLEELQRILAFKMLHDPVVGKCDWCGGAYTRRPSGLRDIAVEVVKAIAGHEDIATTIIYTHLGTKHIIRTFQEACGI